jgi:hypothetical protein
MCSASLASSALAAWIVSPRSRRTVVTGGAGPRRPPLDPQARRAPAQLVGDGDVAPRVSQPDRRGHVEGSPLARSPARPGAGPRRRTAAPLRERAQQQVDRHRIACRWCVARALDADELGAGQLRNPRTPVRRVDAVAAAVDHEHRAADAA